MWRIHFPYCGSNNYNGFCYLSTNKVNWYDGVDFCKRNGGEILSLKTDAEEKFVTDLFPDKVPFWIGYHGHRHSGYQFVWSDGSDGSYSRMDPRSLSMGMSGGLCAVVDKTEWKRRKCNKLAYAICKVPGKSVGSCVMRNA